MLGNLTFLMPLILMVAVLFFLTRADKKKRAQLESTLKKGDRVVTRAGLIGKLTEVGGRTARIELAPGVNVTILKNAIEGIDPGDSPAGGKPSGKDGKDAKDEDKKKK